MSRVAAARMTAPLLAAVALASCSAAGTGEGARAPDPLPQAVAVGVTPDAVQLQAGKTQAFQAVVTGTADTSVGWTVDGGQITDVGFYTAPGTAGTYRVVATSKADTTRSATAVVTVTLTPPPPPPPPPVITVAVTPAAPAVDACRTVTFSAAVAGSTNTGVTWSVPDGGAITTAGVFTAPAADGTYRVVATSKANTTVSQTATVTVSTRILGVAISPATLSISPGHTTQFTATVTTTCGSFAALRTIDSAGVITAN